LLAEEAATDIFPDALQSPDCPPQNSIRSWSPELLAQRAAGLISVEAKSEAGTHQFLRQRSSPPPRALLASGDKLHDYSLPEVTSSMLFWGLWGVNASGPRLPSFACGVEDQLDQGQ
jgi:hypothetical protein